MKFITTGGIGLAAAAILMLGGPASAVAACGQDAVPAVTKTVHHNGIPAVTKTVVDVKGKDAVPPTEEIGHFKRGELITAAYDVDVVDVEEHVVHHEAVTHVVHHEAVTRVVHHEAVTHVVHHEATYAVEHQYQKQVRGVVQQRDNGKGQWHTTGQSFDWVNWVGGNTQWSEQDVEVLETGSHSGVQENWTQGGHQWRKKATEYRYVKNGNERQGQKLTEPYDETVVDHEAYDETVVDHEAYDETVIDEEAYDETVPATYKKIHHEAVYGPDVWKVDSEATEGSPAVEETTKVVTVVEAIPESDETVVVKDAVPATDECATPPKDDDGPEASPPVPTAVTSGQVLPNTGGPNWMLLGTGVGLLGAGSALLFRRKKVLA